MNKQLITTIPVSIAMGLSMLILLAACGVPGGSTGTTLSTKPGAAPNRNTATAVLLHAPQGTSDLTWNSQQQTLTVAMKVQGLAPGSTHPAHIHLGVCDAPRTMLYSLPPLVANDLGQATMSKVVIKHVAHLPAQGWLINVHNGPTMVADQGQNLAITCGTLTMKEGGASRILNEHVVLGSTTAPSESASGTANLSVDAADTLNISVKVHGLEPGSRHAVHIHSGSCDQQGKMLYPLSVLVADANGDASETATFPHVGMIPASGWYINVHFAEGIATTQGKIITQAFNPIACGNVNLS